MRGTAVLILLVMAMPLSAQAPVKKLDGNRLAYLDEFDPYYPNRDFPKLTTPQWVGDKDVECVVVLAIDDMRDPKPYETFLRPILRRLKEIDGRCLTVNEARPREERGGGGRGGGGGGRGGGGGGYGGGGGRRY